MIPQHSSATNEHYTPANVVEAARKLLGAIDLDPASCEEANRTIRASRIYTIDDDGLTQPWAGRTFLNPPGGRLRRSGDRWVPVKGGKAESSMKVWWDRLGFYWQRGEVSAGFFVAFTLEILRTAQSCKLPVQAFPRCYPRDRLCFGGDDPTHANVLVWLPPPGMSADEAMSRMVAACGDIGLCENGDRWTRARND